MNKYVFLLCMVLVTGCSPAREVVQIFKGDPGANGHSLVSQYMDATELECGAEGGSRLDIYMDSDDSLTPSEGDAYQNSLIACNGANGIDGTDGSNGNNGHDGIAGPPGSSGPPGLNGNPGHDGSPGPSGAPGTPGAPGNNGNNGQDGHGQVIPKNVSGTCSNISTGYDALIKNQTVELYTAGKSCGAPYKVFVLTTSASTFWLSNTELAVFIDPAGLRVLSF